MKVFAWIFISITMCVAVAPAFARDGAPAEERWEAAQSRLFAELGSSPIPRDRTLAASAQASRGDGESAATLAQVAAAAPDDVLVQWLAAVQGDDAVTTDTAIAALVRLEPDNAATWLLATRAAVLREDTAGLDAALVGFAASTRFDDHYAGLLHAWLDALQRHPQAPSACEAAVGCDHRQSDFLVALAWTTASVFPSAQPLLEVCNAAVAGSLRHQQCEAGGRGMLTNASTLVSATIGYALLDRIGALTASDEELRRRHDWLSHVLAPVHRDMQPGSADFAAMAADWLRLDSEIEVMRSMARRAGKPVLPPDGWTSPRQHARASTGRGNG